jgi:hypothetical protein
MGCVGGFTAAVFIVCAFFVSACNRPVTVTGLPPGVSNAEVNNWISAVSDLDKAYAITNAIQKSVIALNKTPLPNGGTVFPDGTIYVAFLQGIGHAYVLENQAAVFLKTVPNDFGQPVKTKLGDFTTQILTALQNSAAQAAFGIKDSTSAQLIAQSFASAIATINLVRQLAGLFAAQIFRYIPQGSTDLVTWADYADLRYRRLQVSL